MKCIFSRCGFLLPTPTKAGGTESGNEGLATLTVEIRTYARWTLETGRHHFWQQERMEFGGTGALSKQIEMGDLSSWSL